MSSNLQESRSDWPRGQGTETEPKHSRERPIGTINGHEVCLCKGGLVALPLVAANHVQIQVVVVVAIGQSTLRAHKR